MSTTWLWPILIGYGALMFLISPTATRFGEFFASRREGRDIGMGVLISTVVISWIFAKSITNASNLGASYGIVGSVAYAGWYLSIPVAGLVIYAIRTKLQADSLAGFLTSKYGRGATLAFMLVILLRLTNEVWSNTAVVGAYFGVSGSASYFTAAMLFAVLTLFYSLRGGLRSSIVTDLLQFGLGVFLLVFVLAMIVPKSGVGALLGSGSWTLRGGVDLLLVALLQSLSYPFHDPVLTDRAFITRPLVMLKGYLIAGVVAAAFITLFGLTGVHAKLFALDVGQDAPLRVANAFGVATLTIMTVLMMVSAGSTLDSTLSSFSRAVVMDVGGRHLDGGAGTGLTRGIERRLANADPLRVGRIAMILAVLVGSAPLFAGAAIIKATTVSGTMVLGLAPPFLLFAWARARTWAFHLGFWPGVVVGTLYAIGRVPESWALGDGPYAALLGANVVGSALVLIGFGLGAWLDGVRRPRRTALLVAASAALAGVPTSVARADDNTGKLRFSGQTMFRLTLKLRDFDRPAAELYNLRLVAERSVSPFRYLAEVRFRQTPLRSFSPSNTWIQQAYVAWSVTPELTLSGGLLYNQLGLFWDGSWFGNLPYLNGHKLDPDMNLEAKWRRPASKGTPGVTAWLQLSPAEDGLNGTFFTSGKADRLRLPPDLETSAAYREGPTLRARVVPVVHIGRLVVEPGGSLQHATYDRAQSDTTGTNRVLGTELTFRYGALSLGAEALFERVTGFTNPELSRDYRLAHVDAVLRERDTEWFPLVEAGVSVQRTTYDPEDFEETFLTARVFTRVTKLIGTTIEYVRWSIENDADPLLDRFELILHAYY